MLVISIRKGQKFEDALKAFNSKCKKEGILEDYKKRMTFEKRSDRKRREKKKQIKRAKRDEILA